MLETLNKGRKSGDDYDIELKVNGATVYAHRSILCANSEYFRCMLKGSYKESGQNRIDVSNAFPDLQALQSIIEYFYIGVLEICDDNYEEILNCACHLLVENVIRHCESFLLQNLTEDNCLFMWALAEKHMLQNLRKLCKRIAECRFHDLLRLVPGTLEISDQFLKDILNNEAIVQHLPFNHLVDFLQKWVDCEKENRTHKLREVLSGDVLRRRYPSLNDILNLATFDTDPLGTLRVPSQPPQQVTKSGRPKRTVKKKTQVKDIYQEAVVVDGKGASVAWLAKEMRWVRLPKYPQPEFAGQLKGYSTVGFVNPTERSAKLVLKESYPPGEYYLFDVASGSTQKLPTVRHSGKYMNLNVFCLGNSIFYSVIDATSLPWQDNLSCTWTLYKVNFGDWSRSKLEKGNEVVKRSIMSDVQLPVNVAGAVVRDRFTQQVISKSGSAYVIVQAKFVSKSERPNENPKGWIKMLMFEINQGRNTSVRLLKQELISNDALKMSQYQVVGGPSGFQKLSVSRNNPELLGSVVEVESICSFQGKKSANVSVDSHFGSVDIPLDFASNFKGAAMTAYSATENRVYQARFICPFVSEFWVFDVEKKEWNSMRPPPIEISNSSTRMHVIYIPQAFLLKLESAEYLVPKSDNKNMFHGKYAFKNSEYVSPIDSYSSFSRERVDRLGLRVEKLEMSDYKASDDSDWNMWNALYFDDDEVTSDDDTNSDGDGDNDDDGGDAHDNMLLPLLHMLM